ncbi:MAG: hypothetical protein DI527_06490 [Chelatococcus sp.]|nr:MAG: hypothetical protein DI527_06490 [Chelatococcus sp.]
MAYILRSLAVIGVIALNSPVHGGRSADHDRPQHAQDHVASAAPTELRGANGAISAAREAAQILAGLDPETRERLLTLAATAASGRAPPR